MTTLPPMIGLPCWRASGIKSRSARLGAYERLLKPLFFNDIFIELLIDTPRAVGENKWLESVRLPGSAQ